MSSFEIVDESDNAGVDAFLRQEQETLGETGDFGFVAPSEDDPFAAPADEGSDPFAAPADEDPFAAPAEQDPFSASSETAEVAEVASPVASTSEVSSPSLAADPYSAIAVAQETPQVIIEWRRKRDELLEAKDKTSREKSIAIQQEAKKALEDWYTEYNAKKKSTLENNKNAEQAFIEGRDAPVKGSTWEIVNNNIDTAQKNQKSQKDVSRMRSILVQLKTAPNAPSA